LKKLEILDNITFFIPAYNCSKTIAESVDSIVETNFGNGDELIIVNDFSSDDTCEVLKTLRKKYPVITVIDHKRNKGGAAARNTAVENAKHELLFCLDADNVLEKNSIRPLMAFLLTGGADIACFNELRYFSDSISTIDETWFFEPGEFTIEHLLSGKLSPGASGNYLFTKISWSKAGGYAEDMGALDTWSFGFKQLMEQCKMAVMPGSYYFHRRGHESYYIRDAWKKRRSVSLRLIKLIINYIDRINPQDVDYIFSKKGRFSWFDDLSKRPIRLIEGAARNAVWEDHGIEEGIVSKIKHKAGHYKTRLSQVMRKK
jgi:glycosyltransferase involved in cell wall biosynthesis